MSNVVPFTPRPTSPVSAPTALPATRPQPADRAVYTVKEAAELLSLSLGSTYALIRSGTIPAIKLGGRWVIPKRRFHTWLDNLTETAPENTGHDLGQPAPRHGA